MSPWRFFSFKAPHHQSKFYVPDFKQQLTYRHISNPHSKISDFSVCSALKFHPDYNSSQGSGIISDVGTERFYESVDDYCDTLFIF